MEKFKTLINILITTIVTGICWLPFYIIGPKTLLTGGLTAVVGVLISSIIVQYVLRQFDKTLSRITRGEYYRGVSVVPTLVYEKNRRWSEKDTPIFGMYGDEVGTQTNYSVVLKAVGEELRLEND